MIYPDSSNLTRALVQYRAIKSYEKFQQKHQTKKYNKTTQFIFRTHNNAKECDHTRVPIQMNDKKQSFKFSSVDLDAKPIVGTKGSKTGNTSPQRT